MLNTIFIIWASSATGLCLYILAMGIYRAWLDKRMPKWMIGYLSPVVLTLILLDVALNLIIAPLIFLDLPREWLLTRRLQRYVASEYLVHAHYKLLCAWRRWLARLICDKALDLFDPSGDHC